MRIDNIQGFTTPRFRRLEKIFRANFESGWEREGAAVAIYHHGKLVVDLQGGWADRAAGRKWTDSTRTVVFSASKAIGALCVAMLVDRGRLSYADLVVKHWPEFGQNGKENITVDWIMSHRAGLAALDETVTLDDALDWKRMAKILERARPMWTPGERSGYHALTYGWLVDQLVRRADPQGRSIGQFFREEVAEKHDIDFHLGLPPSEEHTVSRLSMPSKWHLMRELVHDPRVLFVIAIFNLRLPTSIAHKVRKNPDWFRLDSDVVSFNDPTLHQLEQVAALGITRARDMGRIFALMLSGALIRPELVRQFAQPTVTSGLDAVVLAPMPKGYGFLYERHPTHSDRYLVGHPGYGGSTVMMDLEEELVISYVSNGLKTGMGELTRTYRHLRDAAFQALRDELPKEIPPSTVDLPSQPSVDESQQEKEQPLSADPLHQHAPPVSVVAH